MAQLKPHLKRWTFQRRVLYRVTNSFIPRLSRFLFHFEVNNIDYAYKFPEGEPVIICGNHRSHLDGPFVYSALLAPYGPRRFLTIMTSGRAMQQNFLFKITPLFGAFPVDPDKPTLAFEYIIRSLKEGFAGFIFPQGRHFNRTPFHDYFSLVEEGRTGVGRIILKMNGEVPVLPLYIHGTGEALQPGKIKPRFRSFISVTFGKPLYFHQYSRKNGWTDQDPDFFVKARELTNIIMNSIRNQFLECEKYYFQFLEWKFKTEINKITFPPEKEKTFKKFLRKLALVPPKQLQEYLQSKSISLEKK